MNKYKIVPFDEIHDIWILKRKIWWIFYEYAGLGTKAELEKFIKEKTSC
jgi:hypothetical protein